MCVYHLNPEHHFLIQKPETKTYKQTNRTIYERIMDKYLDLDTNIVFLYMMVMNDRGLLWW